MTYLHYERNVHSKIDVTGFFKTLIMQITEEVTKLIDGVEFYLIESSIFHERKFKSARVILYERHKTSFRMKMYISKVHFERIQTIFSAILFPFYPSIISENDGVKKI